MAVLIASYLRLTQGHYETKADEEIVGTEELYVVTDREEITLQRAVRAKKQKLRQDDFGDVEEEEEGADKVDAGDYVDEEEEVSIDLYRSVYLFGNLICLGLFAYEVYTAYFETDTSPG